MGIAALHPSYALSYLIKPLSDQLMRAFREK
jgi:hypothetical protein